jgi:hypothetical protein
MAIYPGGLIEDPSKAQPPAGGVWVADVFERSGGAGWIWYVVCTLRPGTTQGRFPIPVFRSLLAQGLASRGDVPGGFSDAVLDRMESERLTPEEKAAKDAQRAANARAARRANCTAGEDCRTARRVAEDMIENAPEVANELGHSVGSFFGAAASVVGRTAGAIASLAGSAAGNAAAGFFGGLSPVVAVSLGVAALGAVLYGVGKIAGGVKALKP